MTAQATNDLAAEAIAIETASISITLIIFIVLFFEFLFLKLHEVTKDTAFQELVSAIEKELMIVGCMAFGFKLITNYSSNILDNDWHNALNFAGNMISSINIVPIFAYLII